MREGSPEQTRVRVVYCGGCNPHIDREAVANALPVDDPDVPRGATVHLSGCRRACASDHQLVVADGDEPDTLPYGQSGAGGGAALAGRAGAGAEGAPAGPEEPPVVVVAGELVDGVPTPCPELASTVTRKLKE